MYALFDLTSDLVLDIMRDSLTEVAQGISYAAITYIMFVLVTRRSWRQREFMVMNFTLTSVVRGNLTIRTLLEKSLSEVLLNPVPVAQVEKAMRQASPDQPMLRFVDSDTRWSILNLVANELSEKFADGFLRRDLGEKVRSARYLICLVYETGKLVRHRKVRVLVVRKDFLTNLHYKPKLTSIFHEDRYRSIEAMRAAYLEDPASCREIELCF